MKNGYTVVELIVYLALVSVFLSLMIPSFWRINEELMFKADMENVQHMIRYARQVSLMKKMKSAIFLSGRKIYVTLNGKKVKERSLSVSSIKGKREFAFSKGIPYKSGKFFLSFKKEKFLFTLQPVTGTLKVDRGEGSGITIW